jgi:hypothetical protein
MPSMCTCVHIDWVLACTYTHTDMEVYVYAVMCDDVVSVGLMAE